QLLPLGFGDYDQVSFVFFRDDGSKLSVRLLAVVMRIYIRVASRQQNTIQTGHRGGNILDFRYQTQMYRYGAACLDRFAVITTEIKSTRFHLEPHCNTDPARSAHKLFNVQTIRPFMSI